MTTPAPGIISHAQDFAEITGVSRETLSRLTAYSDVLKKWQSKINLIGSGTLPQIWHRHFYDSAQLWPLIEGDQPPATPPNGGSITPTILLDMGSGAGFPGLVLAIMATEAKPNLQIHLVESDHRKCAFLREVARITETNVRIHPRRIEHMETFPVDIITARACAPLDRLIGYANRFWGPATRAFFLKGQDIEKELVLAAKSWRMVTSIVPSQTDRSGAVLCVNEVRSV